MSLEFILWMVAGLVISEIFFILFIKWKIYKKKEWKSCKAACFLIGSFFTAVQAAIVFTGECVEFPCEGNYFMLVYELGVILGIAILFYINSWIKDKL